MFSFEKKLRNERESFDKMRSLSPTRYRFRVLDASGQDIKSSHSTMSNEFVREGTHDVNFGKRNDLEFTSQPVFPISADHIHSTRVE